MRVFHRDFQTFQNIQGLLLFLDFENAFDTIAWPFIRKTFQYFGFGSNILKWLNLFYCRPESCVLNNGWTSHFFEIQRGVRQGCRLSPYLFVLSIEVLANVGSISAALSFGEGARAPFPNSGW